MGKTKRKEERRREKRDLGSRATPRRPRCPPTHNSLSSRFISLSPYPYPNIMASAMLTRKNVVVPRTTGHARNTTHAVVVRATHNETTSTRRQMFGLLGGAAFLGVARNANAGAIDLIDDKTKGLDFKNNISDQARNYDIDNKVRRGLEQASSDKAFTIKRVNESKDRLEKDVLTYVSAASWYAAKQELRRQLGTMSFDMNTLVAASGDKQKGAALKKDFFTSVDSLDFAIRKKDKDAALKYQAESLSKLNDFIAFAT